MYLTLQLKLALCNYIAISHFLAPVFQHFSTVHNIFVGGRLCIHFSWVTELIYGLWNYGGNHGFCAWAEEVLV